MPEQNPDYRWATLTQFNQRCIVSESNQSVPNQSWIIVWPELGYSDEFKHLLMMMPDFQIDFPAILVAETRDLDISDTLPDDFEIIQSAEPGWYCEYIGFRIKPPPDYIKHMVAIREGGGMWVYEAIEYAKRSEGKHVL